MIKKLTNGNNNAYLNTKDNTVMIQSLGKHDDRVCKIDEADWHTVRCYKWYISSNDVAPNKYYPLHHQFVDAFGNKKHTALRMSHLILDMPPRQTITYYDCNSLNLTRANMLISPVFKRAILKENTSGYHNVSRAGRRGFKAAAVLHGIDYHIKSSKDPLVCAKAFNEWVLNLPIEDQHWFKLNDV